MCPFLLFIEFCDSCNLIDEFSPLKRSHFCDSGHIALHDHIAPLWSYPCPGKVCVNLRERACAVIEVVVAVVPAPGLPDPAGDLDCIAFRWEKPIAVIESDRDQRGINLLTLPIPVEYQVSQFLCSHRPGTG